VSAAPLWGIGQWVDDAGVRRTWKVGHEEIHRAIRAAPELLGALGVVRRARVLYCSMLSEAAQYWPLIVGAMLTGAQLSCADATAAEAPRVAMFTRQLDYRAVLGVTPELIDGLVELGYSLAEVFGRVPVVGARPGAYERLVAAGIEPHLFVLVGPAVAVGRVPGGPAIADADEWALDTDPDGVVTVTSRRERATRFERARTAITATVLAPDRLMPTLRQGRDTARRS
jgi:hypothetical protein